MLEPLLQTAAAVGLDLDVSSSKALADSLDRAVVITHRVLLILYILHLYFPFMVYACASWSLRSSAG